jgi:hypothetical protein
MTHLFVSEPPLRFGKDEPPADLAERLQALVDADRPAEAVVTFQRENVRLTEPMIEQLRKNPDFAAMLPLAQRRCTTNCSSPRYPYRLPRCSALTCRQQSSTEICRAGHRRRLQPARSGDARDRAGRRAGIP